MKQKLFMVFFLLTAFSCTDKPLNDKYNWVPMTVTATAYNSLPYQTSYEHPAITAWGDSIKPGQKWIAVSRDLLKKGLHYNTMVKIDTFEGVYLVKDKMHSRWRNRIDIYMGENVNKAKKWGRRKINILYAVEKDSLEIIE
ncbi:3D (Asp-Asp-Asp) domain-containing protein [Maribacter caenipelagi]|uniref:3D (Asp-Asp-Asp) domain-containing protein n=1 Tax=Maribacter caenipelagi TaxID=1447781 RepID=A0A4R7D241_9FLAO|nr:3D domain-containing protein [Maribacter caenipelagi]TDS15053.1 3D (Asp-Asp-Asp) domain-containing protein [Maribacter caenipelagi]